MRISDWSSDVCSSDLHTLYASYSQGFKGGGFDPRGVGVNAPAAVPGSPTDAEVSAFLSFLPEQVDSYEVGYKGSLLDGAVNVALAAFYADYSDVQIPGSVRSEEHTSELQSLMRISYAVFCLKKKKHHKSISVSSCCVVNYIHINNLFYSH